jgi:hypothetical protein
LQIAHNQINDNPAAGDGTGANQFNFAGTDYNLTNEGDVANGLRDFVKAKSEAVNPLTDGA